MGAGNPFCAYPPEAAAHAAPGFEWVILPRHGLRPLAAPLRALLHASNSCCALPCWSELTLWETPASTYVCSITHHLPGPLGGNFHQSWHHETAGALREGLQQHEPLAAISLPAPQPRQENSQYLSLIREFRGAWYGLLRALLGPSFA